MKDIRILLKIKNNLILKMAEDLWETTNQNEISRKIGISPSRFGGYINFKRDPIKYAGGINQVSGKIVGWKSEVYKISEAFGCEPEDIFPEHLQKIRKNNYEIECDSQFLIEDIKNQEELVLDSEIKKMISSSLQNLNRKEETILRLRFGFEEDGEHTFQEIANQLGLTRERVRQIEAKALRKLRVPLKELC